MQDSTLPTKFEKQNSPLLDWVVIYKNKNTIYAQNNSTYIYTASWLSVSFNQSLHLNKECGHQGKLVVIQY